MVTLLTLKQEVRGSKPPQQSLEPKHPHTLPPGRKDVSRVPERDGVRESRAPGMTKKKLRKIAYFLLYFLFFSRQLLAAVAERMQQAETEAESMRAAHREELAGIGRQMLALQAR